MDQCWSLFLTTGWNTEYQITAEQLAGAVARSWYTVSAYDADQFVGFGRVVGDEILHGMIYDVIVHPAYQRQGIGGRILDRLVQRCLEAHIRDIQLFCSHGNQTFCEKRGFRVRPRDAPGMEYVATK